MSLKTLPIKGYEVRDGQDYKDGIPFERVNKAKQVAVAFQEPRRPAVDVLEAVVPQGVAPIEHFLEQRSTPFLG